MGIEAGHSNQMVMNSLHVANLAGKQQVGNGDKLDQLEDLMDQIKD